MKTAVDSASGKCYCSSETNGKEWSFSTWNDFVVSF